VNFPIQAFHLTDANHIPVWVILAAHAAIGLGTMAGGWRIVKTMGQRITKLTPFGGFAAETSGADHALYRLVFWNSGEHDAHDYRRHHRCRRQRTASRRCVGRGSAHGLGVDADDPGSGGESAGSPTCCCARRLIELQGQYPPLLISSIAYRTPSRPRPEALAPPRAGGRRGIRESLPLTARRRART